MYISMHATAPKYIGSVCLCPNIGGFNSRTVKVILHSYLIFKKMNERITDS